MVELLISTEPFSDLHVAELAEAVVSLGVKGVELLVRDGSQVTPHNVAHRLSTVVDTLRASGVEVSSVATGLASRDDPGAEEIFAACGDNSIRRLRAGLYGYNPREGFATSMRRARLQFNELVRLGRKYQVRPMLKLDGDALQCSGRLARELVEGLDPIDVGLYADPGNMVAGRGAEPWEMHFDLLGEYLCCVGVRNCGYFASSLDGGVKWTCRWVGLQEGLVPWEQLISLLKQGGYDGPLCLHSPCQDRTSAEVLEQTKRDVAWVRELVDKA